MNYKDTLNLPKTPFSMKANLSSLEPKMLSAWKENGLYEKMRDSRKNNKKFVLHDGPPYANGLIHIGHALNKILKDIIIKYKTIRGHNCLFVVGWDCHGLPVEHQLFKELKLTKHDVEIVNFRKKAKQYALKFVKLQSQDFQRLGIFSDWDNPYLTINKNYEALVIELLGALTSAGYIYRGRKPVNWCGVCETALAEAEVEYANKQSDSIYLLFKIINSKNVFNEKDIKNASFLVWTTTPWTLVSNVAVAVHPELTYSLVRLTNSNKIIILNQERIPNLEEKFSEQFEIIQTIKGIDLEGILLQHPFLDRKPEIVLADFVSQEEGSGCVHIAPGHGEEDFSLTKKYGLDIIMPIDDKGIFQEPDDFKGKDINQANKIVLDKLKNDDFLVNADKITHSYPHCWRCKQPIIFRATFQWFLEIDHFNLRNKILDEVDKVKWVPAYGKERMRSMVSSRPDWCLSRQRLWGIPIPAVRCDSCNEVILSKEIIDKTTTIFNERGSDSWFYLEIENFIPGGFTCCKCGKDKFQKETDILDVWFESGASFLSVVKNNPELNFPADLYLEGSDQHRGWFQASLIPSVAKEQISPFKTILTHGFVVDAEGKKMSKSLGNIISPQDITKRYGSEILRFWTAYTDYNDDIKISDDIIKQLADMYRKVRNTIRFILGNISDFDIKVSKVEINDLGKLDRFVLSRSMNTFKDIIKCYDNFSFYKACQGIFNFCNIDMSSFYLDILKDRLYTFPENSKERRSAQQTLYIILENLLTLIAPILSFTAEEAYGAWGNLSNKKESIFLSSLDNDYIESLIDKDLINLWDRLLDLRAQTLKKLEDKREQGLIGSSLQAAVTLHLDDKDYATYSCYGEVFREMLIVSAVQIKKGNFKIIVESAKGDKCLRCWNVNITVGKNDTYPDVCDRCLAALA